MLATEAKAHGMQYFTQAGSPITLPIMAFSLSLIYPGILSCHVPLYLIGAKILLTTLHAYAAMVMHTKMLMHF